MKNHVKIKSYELEFHKRNQNLGKLNGELW